MCYHSCVVVISSGVHKVNGLMATEVRTLGTVKEMRGEMLQAVLTVVVIF